MEHPYPTKTPLYEPIVYPASLSSLGIDYQRAADYNFLKRNQLPAIGDTVHYGMQFFGFDPNGTGPVTNKLWDQSEGYSHRNIL
ncbi:MAG: hypothetical protein IPJ86_14440 [Bacteroidetes bacterium]|nr:hypothetical protein [Bacteroidota bacterium]